MKILSFTTVLSLIFIQVVLSDTLEEGEKSKNWKAKKPTNILKKKYWMLDKQGRAEKEKPDERHERPRKKYKPEEGHDKEEEIHVQHAQTQEKFLKDEAVQICETMSEDSVQDTLVKFGLVTKVISDVYKFRTTMKSLLDRIPISKQKPGDNKVQKKKEERRLGGSMHAVLDDYQPDYLGRSIQGYISPGFDDLAGIYEQGSNKLGGDLLRDRRSLLHSTGAADTFLKALRARRSTYLDAMDRRSRRKGTTKNFDQVPQCYGWRYLSSINALTKEDSVDTAGLTQSVSDMLDMRFADTVTTIMETCQGTTTNVQGLCPPAEDEVEGRSDEECRNLCMVNEDCGYQEICCRQNCRNECMSISGTGYNRCDQADRFMQCLYNMIDSKICDGVSGK